MQDLVFFLKALLTVACAIRPLWLTTSSVLNVSPITGTSQQSLLAFFWQICHVESLFKKLKHVVKSKSSLLPFTTQTCDFSELLSPAVQSSVTLLHSKMPDWTQNVVSKIVWFLWIWDFFIKSCPIPAINNNLFRIWQDGLVTCPV